MSDICLDGPKLKMLIEERYPKGVSDLLEAWTVSEVKVLSKPPDRSTLYRWTKGQLPRSPDDLLSLCCLLDVDPFSLLAADDGMLSTAINKLLGSVQLRQWKQPALRFLADLFGRQQAWPPPSLAEDYYRHPWFIEDFEHDPNKQALYYACIELSASEPINSALPQVFHFAFKSPGFFEERWLQYGFVERYENTVRLVHINGYSEEYTIEDTHDPSRVETWFGPGPAVFRVASLHPFVLDVKNNSGEAQRVRFPA